MVEDVQPHEADEEVTEEFVARHENLPPYRVPILTPDSWPPTLVLQAGQDGGKGSPDGDADSQA